MLILKTLNDDGTPLRNFEFRKIFLLWCSQTVDKKGSLGNMKRSYLLPKN